MTTGRSELDRILNAFGHPVRRLILGELIDGPASASMISRSFRLDLGVVSYHLGRVLAKQCEVVELVDSVPRRGSVEKLYGLRLEGPIDLPAPGEPGSWDELVWTMALAQCLFEAIKGEQ